MRKYFDEYERVSEAHMMKTFKIILGFTLFLLKILAVFVKLTLLLPRA